MKCKKCGKPMMEGYEVGFQDFIQHNTPKWRSYWSCDKCKITIYKDQKKK